MGSTVIVTKIADNIVSPLGWTTNENFEAVVEGKTAISEKNHSFGLSTPFTASLLDRELVENKFRQLHGIHDELTMFEKLCIISITHATQNVDFDLSSPSTIFVMSSTKGNVHLLERNLSDERCYIATSAKKIAQYFGNFQNPIVISNACISGVSAQITAIRMLLSGKYQNAVVFGCDILSRFIISGFQSFNALSCDRCKPFDKNRDGLNLGEAAATLILSRGEQNNSDYGWRFAACSNHNDANHISGPSRTGEGSYRVLNDILANIGTDDLAFINTHGTATPYNDEMESIALHRAHLDKVPINALKGYFGHTLGAAGILETILSMKAVDNNLILPTIGYESTGTTYPLNISNQLRHSAKKTFIKILSGFGGSNAGIAYTKGGDL